MREPAAGAMFEFLQGGHTLGSKFRPAECDFVDQAASDSHRELIAATGNTSAMRQAGDSPKSTSAGIDALDVQVVG